MFTSWLGLFYTVYPCAFLSSIILSTTKVNAFLTAMNKVHIPKKVLIPLAVMLRYIPTVREDWAYIKDAMRLRDVHPSSYNQVVFIENPKFFTWYISVRRASVMDISLHQVPK